MLLRQGLGVYVPMQALNLQQSHCYPRVNARITDVYHQAQIKEKLIFPNHPFNALTDKDYLRARTKRQKEFAKQRERTELFFFFTECEG